MIKKLSINYASAIYPNEKMLAEKINEIIDHLSQEKCTCKDILSASEDMILDKNCPIHKQPTKEVPDIREFLIDNRKIWNNEEWEVIRMKWFKLEEKAQEISALYRKDV